MPINTNAWNRARYTVFAPFYDRIASFAKQRQRAVELLQLRPGERVLISGAGTGADIAFMPRDIDIVAVDITPAMVERTRHLATQLGYSIEAEEGDAQALRFADGTFDAVVLNLAPAAERSFSISLCRMMRVCHSVAERRIWSRTSSSQTSRADWGR